ncbi:hypothetical protein [Acidovorax temperans]|uniref:hypothetical protein n=1 Tax=Acidovorax temperans TaxID=80878 RepID=UPI001427E867|nr:hypothetical protein [Acidovorax temperans]
MTSSTPLLLAKSKALSRQTDVLKKPGITATFSQVFEMSTKAMAELKKVRHYFL